MLKKNIQFIVAIALTVCISAGICVGAFFIGNQKVKYSINYNYICLYIADNALSASAFSDATSSYGGAGYVLEYEDNYYIVASCYYSAEDADTIYNSLLKNNINCTKLVVKKKSFPVSGTLSNTDKNLFLGNLNTLDSLSRLSYSAANSLDDSTINQESALSILNEIKSGINGLAEKNGSNIFSDGLKKLITICDDIKGGYIYSKDMRYLQVAITDVIINTL
jgi:hypothetical protein